MIDSQLVGRLVRCCSLWLCLVALSTADDANPTEADYYPITRFELPKGAVIEGGAFQLLPDGRLAVCCRRGDVWLVNDPFAKKVAASQFHLFAQGLHEPLSLAERDGWLYVTQRGDVSRLRDSDGDGAADRLEVVGDAWEINGNYHEYAFASKFDRDGNLWVTLCLTGSFTSDCKYRGWCVRVTPDGQTIPTASGIRSPGGVGMNAEGDVFYTDNQGPWNGTCALKHLSPGKFVGHPGGFRWYDECADVMGPRPREPESGSRFATEAKKIPEYTPPSVLFPYKRMGQSASGVACDTTGGKFGPFEGQLFVGDQTNSTVMRVFLEKVRGHWQGACFPFREGFGSGIVGLEMTPQGALFAGSTNRGWGARGDVPFAIERVDWSGKVPFEIRTMSARPDGFELTFTQPVDPATAGDPASYRMATHTYIFQSTYGSPEVDQTTSVIEGVTVSDDRLSVSLKVNGLQEGHVHELFAEGVRSHEGRPLLHDEAYYTLMYLAE